MSTTPTFEDTFSTLSLWNGSTGNWQPAYDWSPDGYTNSSMSSWLVNPAYGPTSEADADVYSINGNGLNMAIKPLPADVARPRSVALSSSPASSLPSRHSRRPTAISR